MNGLSDLPAASAGVKVSDLLASERTHLRRTSSLSMGRIRSSISRTTKIETEVSTQAQKSCVTMKCTQLVTRARNNSGSNVNTDSYDSDASDDNGSGKKTTRQQPSNL